MGLLGRLSGMMGRGGRAAMGGGDNALMGGMGGGVTASADDAAFQSFKVTAASRLSQTNPEAAAAISQANSIEEINAILRQVAQPDEAYQMRSAVTQQRNSPYGSY